MNQREKKSYSIFYCNSVTDSCTDNNRLPDKVPQSSRSGGGSELLLRDNQSCHTSRLAMVNVMNKVQVSLLIILFVSLAGVTGVHINDLRVPPVIRNGTEEFVILDCDYHIEEKEKVGLVVKWFFNKEPTYQWIPNQRPLEFGILRGKLNLDYKADSDVYKMYRALKIIRPSIELSGEWICRVSTFEGEAYKAATMIVYAPESDMKLKVSETRRPGFVNISCWANGVFPEPKLTVHHGPNKEQKVEDMVFSTRFNKGAYDVSAYKVIEDANLSSISSVFDCELNIPNTNYMTRRSTLYDPASMAVKEGRIMGSGGGGWLPKSSSDFSSTFNLLLTSTLVTNYFYFSLRLLL